MSSTELTVDKFHLALAKRLNISDGDLAPVVDQKRPYGNSDVLKDLQNIYSKVNGFEIIRIEDGGTLVLSGDRVVGRGDNSGDPLKDAEKLLWSYHRDMATVLEILLDTFSLTEGVYKRSDPYRGKWELTSVPREG